MTGKRDEKNEKKVQLVRLPNGHVISKAEFDSGPDKGKCILLGAVDDGDNHLVHIALHGFEVPPTE
jgi:hypothetical protein